FTAFAEQWLPDAFVFALAATVVVFVAGLAIGVPARDLVQAWGQGFPDLLAFTMQMVLVIVTGYVVASSRPVYRLIWFVAERSPRSARGAVAMVTVFALSSSWINWGFSLIFSAVLAKEVARRRPGVDYRALAAASLLGLGSVWAQGLSGSAALQMATPKALPEPVRAIIARGGLVGNGIIDFTHTIFWCQGLVSVAVGRRVVTGVVGLAAPPGAHAKDAASLGIAIPPPLDDDDDGEGKTFGERLERSPLPLLFV